MLAERRALRSPALIGLLALCLTVTLALAGCDDEPRKRPSGKPGGPTSQMTTLTFGIWGPPEEVRAYQQMVDEYNASTEATDVEIRSWPDAAAMMAELAGGAKVPDLFMITRSSLADVREADLNTPLLELLDERGVDYGDGYYRDAIEAFSGDDDLQCMPYGVSPMIMYYNTRLIDFDRMRARELPTPEVDEEHDLWTFEQFTAAAEFASRPRRHTRGLYVEPSLRGLSPFIYAGGGEVYNDDNEPTSLAFSEDDTREALTESLELLRDPQVTLSDRQLAQRTPLEWFKRGKLGMLPGFRELTPELRAVPNLDFDVMPMPTLDTAATIGDFTGLCISSDSAYVSQAADFLVHAIGEESLGGVTAAGYLAPANLDVATSDAFLQPDQLPAHAGVFNASVSDMVLQPLIDDYAALERAVEGSLRQMFRAPVLDLDALTTQIDEDSRALLDPDYESETPDPESPSDSDSPSE
ncbi:MAG TPA: extracellular solute-binding protein [Nocardioides sp.]|nr:extracellular solute-binding protein [Nocardioides sp.]